VCFSHLSLVTSGSTTDGAKNGKFKENILMTETLKFLSVDFWIFAKDQEKCSMKF